MRRFSLFIALSCAIGGSPAIAGSCAAALSAPSSSNVGVSFSMTSMDSSGVVNFAQGDIGFVPSIILKGPKGSFPRPQRWFTATDKPPKLYRDVGPVVSGNNKLEQFVDRPFSISISGLVAPSVTIKYLDKGETFTFTADCSAAMVLHGSAGGADFLVHVNKGAPIL